MEMTLCTLEENMIERLTEIGRFMEMNIGKTTVMRISGQPPQYRLR